MRCQWHVIRGNKAITTITKNYSALATRFAVDTKYKIGLKWRRSRCAGRSQDPSICRDDFGKMGWPMRPAAAHLCVIIRGYNPARVRQSLYPWQIRRLFEASVQTPGDSYESNRLRYIDGVPRRDNPASRREYDRWQIGWRAGIMINKPNPLRN